MSSTVETTAGRPGFKLRRVIDKTLLIFGKEWLYIGEPLFKLCAFQGRLCTCSLSLGIGILLAFINLIMGIISLSSFHPKKERRSN